MSSQQQRARPVPQTNVRMLSSVLATLLAGSAMGISLSKVAVPPSEIQMPPSSSRPVRASFRDLPGTGTVGRSELKWLAGMETKSELEVKSFACGVCGGTGCPMCLSPKPPVFQLSSAGVIEGQSLEGKSIECGVCGGTG